MNFSRQALLGIGMIIGGSVMLYAMLQQIGASDNNRTTSALIEASPVETVSTPPLTTDIETEKKLLAQKQKERALRVAEQERRAEQFLAEQESAEAQALAKSRAENQQYIDNNTPEVIDEDSSEAAPVTPTVEPRTDSNTASAVNTTATINTANNDATAKAKEQVAEAKRVAERQQQVARLRAQADAEAKQKAQDEAKQKAQAEAKQKAEAEAKQKAEQKAKAAQSQPPSAPTDYKVKAGDGLIKLARQYNVPVEALAQANNTTTSATLQLGQTITIPSRKQVARLEREAAEAERKREQEKQQAQAKVEAQKRLEEARKEVKETDAKGSFGVQVSLAADEAAAQRVAQKFKDAGYKVTTSKTSRGVRVVVGPERGKVAALALKDKINNDPKVDTTGAWVKYW